MKLSIELIDALATKKSHTHIHNKYGSKNFNEAKIFSSLITDHDTFIVLFLIYIFSSYGYYYGGI